MYVCRHVPTLIHVFSWHSSERETIHREFVKKNALEVLQVNKS